jgi:hypothetical protein
VAGAAKRPLGDSWAWARRGCRSISRRWASPGCASEDAPGPQTTVKRQRRGRRYGPAIGPAQPRPSTRRNAQEWRATETVVCHRGMAQPYGPPGRRSCGLPVRLPHSWRTWCSLGDPACSGQPCMGTNVPSRDRRNCTRRADEQAEIHRTGPRPRRRRAPPGSWPGPDCDGTSVPGPLASPVGRAVSPRSHRPTEARQLPGRGTGSGHLQGGRWWGSGGCRRNAGGLRGSAQHVRQDL